MKFGSAGRRHTRAHARTRSPKCGIPAIPWFFRPHPPNRCARQLWSSCCVIDIIILCYYVVDSYDRDGSAVTTTTAIETKRRERETETETHRSMRVAIRSRRRRDFPTSSSSRELCYYNDVNRFVFAHAAASRACLLQIHSIRACARGAGLLGDDDGAPGRVAA